MSQANKDRQKAFRERTATTTARLNTPISLEAKQALEHLATQFGVTQRQALEQALLAVQEKLAHAEQQKKEQILDDKLTACRQKRQKALKRLNQLVTEP